MHTLGSLVLALQVQDATAPLAGSGDVIRILRDTGPLNQAVLLLLVIFSVASWAIILHKTLVVSHRRRPDRQVSRGLPEEQQVLRGAGGLPDAARIAPGWRVSSRVRRDERAVPRHGGGRSAAGGQSNSPSGSSNTEEPRSGGPGAHPRRDQRGQQARASAHVPRDDRKRDAVHRTVRDGHRDHDRVRPHRRHRLDQPGDCRAGHQRSADRDRLGPVRGDPGDLSSTTTSRTA